MKQGTREVAEFFGRIAGNYGEKYKPRNAFHHYFFNERLNEAVADRDFSKRSILDIGAGTGSLFDRIIEEFPTADYFAIDISAEMLAASAIPADRRFVGTLADVPLPREKFNYVFLLGVTTYIPDDELVEIFRLVEGLLRDDGCAIVTFTNRRSLDWVFRKALRNLPGIKGRKEFVLSQEFPTYARSFEDVNRMLTTSFLINRVVGLNHTVFPFNQLLKRASVSLARRLHRFAERSMMLTLSSDILVELSKKKQV